MDCNFAISSRAGIWYTRGVRMDRCRLDAPKLLRECQDIRLNGCVFGDSFETGWNSSDITLRQCNLAGNYLFMNAEDVIVEDCTIAGQYAFQHVRRAVLRRCAITSRDILWHANDALVEDCTISTEFLAWHARNVSFVRCILRGPQPLCYGTGLKLRACTLEGADRAFEFSSVDAEIDGHLDSVLNPKAGRVVADSIGIRLQDDPWLLPLTLFDAVRSRLLTRPGQSTRQQDAGGICTG